MRPSGLSSLRRLAAVSLALFGCGSVPGTSDEPLTSAEGVERAVVIAGEVFVEQSASNYTIQQAVQRQVRTAFGPLRIAKISVDDREFRSNVDPATFTKRLVSVVKTDSGAPVEVRKAYRVSYTYRARGLVNKSHANASTLSLALLMGNYQSFVPAIIHQCVENYAHDSDFADSFWYVFAPNASACKQLIATEVEAIAKARDGLTPEQLPLVEHERRFLPITAKLERTAAPPTTYPEYDRLYGINDPSKTRIKAYALFGNASHDDDPEDKRFERDMGFAEFFKAIKVLTAQYKKLRLAQTGAASPFAVPFAGATYTATSFDELKKWSVDGYGLPPAISADHKQAFRRAVHDHLYRLLITLEAPLVVQQGSATKKMVLELNLIFGTDSDWGTRDLFRAAFAKGDVVVYDGHSYIGSGPLDPANYASSDFRSGYQVIFFNSCVSFNYYNTGYHPKKAAGTKDLDLVSNGIESYIYDGGKSMGQFLVALFDGQQHSWLKVLEKTRVPWSYSGYHDPNRAVDGELDNVYDPATTPLKVVEGEWGGGGGGGGGGEGDVLFFDDMEQSTSWVATGLWHATKSSSCAPPGYASPETAWYFGQDGACNYNAAGRVFGALTSAPIAGLSASSKLTFKHYRHVEQASGSYDRTRVEAKASGQNSWTAVWSRDSSSASEQGWIESETIDLARFAGQAIQLRFTFDSVDGYANNFVGWMIDDVRITK